jgi:hypothetical protein
LTEITLSAPLGKYRLVGKFDALAIDQTRETPQAKIFEWKTSQRRPKPAVTWPGVSKPAPTLTCWSKPAPA